MWGNAFHDDNLISSYDKKTDFLDKGNAMEIIYPSRFKQSFYYHTSREVIGQNREDGDQFYNHGVNKEQFQREITAGYVERWVIGQASINVQSYSA